MSETRRRARLGIAVHQQHPVAFPAEVLGKMHRERALAHAALERLHRHPHGSRVPSAAALPQHIPQRVHLPEAQTRRPATGQPYARVRSQPTEPRPFHPQRPSRLGHAEWEARAVVRRPRRFAVRERLQEPADGVRQRL